MNQQVKGACAPAGKALSCLGLPQAGITSMHGEPCQMKSGRQVGAKVDTWAGPCSYRDRAEDVEGKAPPTLRTCTCSAQLLSLMLEAVALVYSAYLWVP